MNMRIPGLTEDHLPQHLASLSQGFAMAAPIRASGRAGQARLYPAGLPLLLPETRGFETACSGYLTRPVSRKYISLKPI